MARQRINNLLWPAGGEHRATAYQRQPPYTCVKSRNVRTQEVLEGRERGGQRPGLRKAFTTQLGGGEPVRMLAQVRENVAGTASRFDHFNYGTYPATWTAPSWLDGVPDLHPDSAPTYIRTTSVNTNGLGLLYAAIDDFDSTSAYTISMMISPVGAGADTIPKYGDYEIAFRMNDSTPVVTTAGCRLVLEGDYSGGAYTIAATLKVYVASVATDYTLTTFNAGSSAYDVRVDVAVTGMSINVKIDGDDLGTTDVTTHGAAAGERIAIGLNSTGSTSTTTLQAQIDWWGLSYIPTDAESPARVWTLAASNSTLYRDDGAGAFASVTASGTLDTTHPVYGVEYLGSLYIADYADSATLQVTDATTSGTTLDSASVADWTTYADADEHVAEVVTTGGTAVVGTYGISTVAAGSVTLSAAPGNDTGLTVRIVRAPKVWDSATNTMSVWIDTSGSIPVDCPLIAVYLGCIVLGGAKRYPHVAYHSAQGDPLDWDTSSTSPTGAYATNSGEQDVIAQPLKALIPYRDDYLIYGCVTEMWVQRGHLKQGGSISNISRRIGIIGPSAWCHLPDGTLVWMSHDGLYSLAPGAMGNPVPVSREKLPEEMLNIDAATVHVQLAWDHKARGIKISLTTVDQNRDHWFLHWKYGAFWREKYANDHQQTAVLDDALIEETPTLLIGCQDGYVREHDAASATDDGTAIDSYVDYGPMRLGRSDDEGGSIDWLVATLARGSNQVNWSVFTAETAEDVSPPYYGGSTVEITTEAGVTLTTEDGDEITTEELAATSGTWSERMNYKNHIHRRGGAYLLKVDSKSDATSPWAIENVAAGVTDGGIAKL